MYFRKHLGYLCLIFGCCWMSAGCANFGNVMTHPEIEVKTVSVVQVNPDTTRLMAVLKLQNPNPLFLHLKRVEYRLLVERTSLVSAATESVPLIKNQHAQTLEIPIMLKNALLDNAFPERGQHHFRFVGQGLASDDWASSPILFEGAGDITFPKLPEIRFVHFNQIQESKKFGFTLELTNPNHFQIQLRRLQGQMELDGHAYVWSTQPKALKIETEHPVRVHIPCQFLGNDSTIFEKDMANLKKGGSVKYWIQGEIESESPFGKMIAVVHAQDGENK